VIANPCFHCWRDAQTLMNPTEVVVHVVQRHSVFQVLKLFAKTIRQSGKSAHSHSHRQILALNVARRNVVVIGRTTDDRFTSAHADCRAVARFRCFLNAAINLLQHRIINLRAEGVFNGCEIGAMTVRSELHAIRQTLFQVVHEMIGATSVSMPDKPARNQFGLRVKRNPCPAIAAAFYLLFCGTILFLCINKIPNLVTLNSTRFKIPECFILILGACTTKIAEKFNHGVFSNARDADGSAKAVPLDQTRNNSRPFFGAQSIHAASMLERSSIVKKDFYPFFRDRNRSKSLQKRRESVTVCIAAICNSSFPTIVGASDRMITSGDIEFEAVGPPDAARPVLKTVRITPQIAIMTAGDAGFQGDAIHNLSLSLGQNQRPLVRDVASMYLDIVNRGKASAATNSVLSPFGLNVDTFISRQREMNDSFVDQVTSAIWRLELGASAIFAGIDVTGAHIYRVTEDGLSSEDAIAFAAIGSGRRHAESQLMLANHHRNASISDTLLLTYVAKKRSEIAPGVGEATDMFVIEASGAFRWLDLKYDIPVFQEIYNSLKHEQYNAFEKAKHALSEHFEKLRKAQEKQKPPPGEEPPPNLPNPSETPT
jgi:hypothetical protein